MRCPASLRKIDPTRRRAIAAIAAALLALGFAPCLRADVTPPALLSTHAVLRKSPATRVWGRAEPGEAMRVTLGRAHGAATAGADGRWQTLLDLSKADAGPFDLVVEGKNKLTVADVVVGENWLCAGQSNMEWSLRGDSREMTAIGTGRISKMETTLPAASDEARRMIPKAPFPPSGTFGSDVYNAMIAPPTPATLRGIVWYQGEANVPRAQEYRESGSRPRRRSPVRRWSSPRPPCRSRSPSATIGATTRGEICTTARDCPPRRFAPTTSRSFPRTTIIDRADTMETFDIRRFGAVGDGRTLNTPAFAAAARACREVGGGVLLGSARIEDHEFEGVRGGILLARDADGITLEGEGVIDGQAAAFFEENVPHVLRDFDPGRTRQGASFGNDDSVGNLDLRPAADHAIAMHAGGTAPVWARLVRNLRLDHFYRSCRRPPPRFSRPSRTPKRAAVSKRWGTRPASP